MELVTQSAEYLERWTNIAILGIVIFAMHIIIIIYIMIIVRFAMHIVNGAGPAPHQEQPEIVNKHIAKFIKGDYNAHWSVMFDDIIDDQYESKKSKICCRRANLHVRLVQMTDLSIHQLGRVVKTIKTEILLGKVGTVMNLYWISWWLCDHGLSVTSLSTRL